MSLRELVESLRHLSLAEPKHKKVMRHAQHAFHASYLSYYVWDWHLPISVITLALLVLALASWVFHLELE